MDNGSTCTTGSCAGFNYCLVAKAIVAVAAIPMIGAVAASFFSEPVWQFTVATYTGAAVVLIAQKIDRIPALTRMVVRRKKP